MALNINGRMKVKTLRADFKKEFGLTLRVYDGRSFADDDSTLAAIRKGDSKGGEFGPRKNTKVGNLEDKIMDMFGIKTQVAGSDDSYLCDNDLTLSGALEADQKKMEKKSKKSDLDENEDTADTLKADREIVLAAVKDDGSTLKNAADTFKADREIVLAAVKNDGDALRYAANTLKADREIILAAMDHDPNLLELADTTLMSDPKLASVAWPVIQKMRAKDYKDMYHPDVYDSDGVEDFFDNLKDGCDAGGIELYNSEHMNSLRVGDESEAFGRGLVWVKCIAITHLEQDDIPSKMDAAYVLENGGVVYEIVFRVYFQCFDRSNACFLKLLYVGNKDKIEEDAEYELYWYSPDADSANPAASDYFSEMCDDVSPVDDEDDEW